MSLRENLAVNLRRLCAARGSIAAVCREMGVNRQQFDRYLSMDALPNRATTTRICEYFGIEEAELYRDPAAADGPVRPARLGRLRGQDAVEAQIMARLFAPPQATIAPGYYQTYFSVPGDPAQILCALTSIRADGGRTTFRRVTGLAETKGTMWSHFRGDHEGVVLERFNWFFFIGLNQRDPQEPTFMAVQWGPFSPETLLCGHAMIFAQSGLAVTTVVMRPVPKGMSLMSALRSARVYTASDPAIGPLVGLALKGKYAPISGT